MYCSLLNLTLSQRLKIHLSIPQGEGVGVGTPTNSFKKKCSFLSKLTMQMKIDQWGCTDNKIV